MEKYNVLQGYLQKKVNVHFGDVMSDIDNFELFLNKLGNESD